MHQRIVVAVILLSFPAAACLAQGVPAAFAYQGVLTEPTGAPVPDGQRAMRFKLFNAETAGTLLWDSGAVNVVTTRGVFSLALGSPPTPPVTSATLASDSVWVEVTVGADDPMPRRALTSAPFAARAGDLTFPFSKSVATSSPAFEVRNTGNAYAIRGESSGAPGAVAGISTATGPGIYGSSAGGFGVYGFNSGAGNVGFLANNNIGAYGAAGGAGFGVYGTNNGSGPGIYGTNTGPGPAAHFDGRVGIGLSNPNRMLYVVDRKVGISYPLKVDNPNSGMGTDAVGILFAAGGDGGGNLNTDRGKGALVYRYADTWNRGSFHFLQETATNQFNPDLSDVVMTIANNGNVGIGSAEPTTKLDVQGLARVSGAATPAGGKGLELAYDAGLNRGYLRVLNRDTSTWGKLALGNGFVGMGTEDPQDRLHLQGADAFIRLDGGATGFSGLKIHENGSPRWNIFFRQWQGDNLIFRDEPASNDTFVLEAGSKTARVNGDLYVTGAVRGGLGPNGGAPFPRPAYDSGWVALGKDQRKQLTHNVGAHVDRYVCMMEGIDTVNGMITNYNIGGDHDSTSAHPREGWYYYGLTTSTVIVHRLDNDKYDADTQYVRIRIWLTN